MYELRKSAVAAGVKVEAEEEKERGGLGRDLRMQDQHR